VCRNHAHVKLGCSFVNVVRVKAAKAASEADQEDGRQKHKARMVWSGVIAVGRSGMCVSVGVVGNEVQRLTRVYSSTEYATSHCSARTVVRRSLPWVIVGPGLGPWVSYYRRRQL